MGKHLKSELEELMKKLEAQFDRVEESVRRAVEAISTKDLALAQQVIGDDHAIDLLEVALEEDSLKILALHHPVANDLRVVISALKINNDLERIGDLAVNIAERAKYLAIEPDAMAIPFDFEGMVEKTRHMLRQALQSFIDQDLKLAQLVCELDDEVDEINREMYQKVFEEIRKTPNRVEKLIQYLSVSRHLERIADYATNIAEDVIYMVAGDIVRHKPEEFRTQERSGQKNKKMN